MIEVKKTCYSLNYIHLILKPQNPNSILAQTHTCDFHMSHINLFFKILFFLNKS
jgi:hypothetical protein